MTKRLALFLTALVVGLGATTPATGQGVGTDVDQLAIADWIEIHGDTGTIHFALGWRMVTEGGVRNLAAVGKGKCHVQRGRNWTSIGCSADGRGKEIPLEDFEVDPLLDSARMRVKVLGYSNRVSWQGRGDAPIVGQDAYAGDGWVEAGADMFRDAKTKARVLGRKFTSSSWLDFGMLLQGAAVYAEVDDGEGIDVSIDDDGNISFRHTIRIRN